MRTMKYDHIHPLPPPMLTTHLPPNFMYDLTRHGVLTMTIVPGMKFPPVERALNPIRECLVSCDSSATTVLVGTPCLVVSMQHAGCSSGSAIQVFFSPSSLNSTFQVSESSSAGKKFPGGFSIDFSMSFSQYVMMSSAIESYHVVLVGDQGQW